MSRMIALVRTPLLRRIGYALVISGWLVWLWLVAAADYASAIGYGAPCVVAGALIGRLWVLALPWVLAVVNLVCEYAGDPCVLADTCPDGIPLVGGVFIMVLYALFVCAALAVGIGLAQGAAALSRSAARAPR
jgi:hypothetical protein